MMYFAFPVEVYSTYFLCYEIYDQIQNVCNWFSIFMGAFS